VDLSALAWALALTLFFSVPLAVTMWALLDAARRPQWAWALAGRSQVLWMVVVILGALTVVGGLAVSTWYLLKVRPLVADAEAGRIQP
jgi:hypothetical protein